MDKDDLIELFNQACIGLAAFLDDHMEEEFPEGEIAVTIPFIESASPSLEDLPLSSDLLSTNGYETLATICEQMENVELSAAIAKSDDEAFAKTPFMLAVSFYSVDSLPLRQKIQDVAETGLFEKVREHYGLN